MIGIYDVSGDVAKGANLLAGEDVRDHLGDINLVKMSSTPFEVTEIGGNPVYFGRFKIDIEEVPGNRKNTCIVVYVGKPESSEAFRKETFETLKNSVTVTSNPVDFMQHFKNTGAGKIPRIIDEIEAKIQNNSRAQLKVGSFKKAAYLSAGFLDRELHEGNFVPVGVRADNSGMDDFGVLERQTENRGLHIVVDEYGTEGINWREKTLTDKIKALF